MVEVVLGGEHAAGVDLALEHRVQQTLIKVIVAHGSRAALDADVAVERAFGADLHVVRQAHTTNHATAANQANRRVEGLLGAHTFENCVRTIAAGHLQHLVNSLLATLGHDISRTEFAGERRAILVTAHGNNARGTAHLGGNHTAQANCAIAHDHGLIFLVDASQTAGVLPIDMEAQQIDLLCFTGHKSLMGPQGTGGLCLGENVALRPWKVGGTGVQTYNPAQPEQLPTRLEAGTLNGHGIAGLSAALDYIRAVGMETIREKEETLMRRFYEGVSAIPGVTVYGDFTAPRTAVVALNIRDYDSGEVSDALAQDYGIATRPGAHCAPRMHRALGTERQGAVRFSFGWFNTEAEIDVAIRAVKELAE